jgi:hypothetical protein
LECEDDDISESTMCRISWRNQNYQLITKVLTIAIFDNNRRLAILFALARFASWQAAVAVFASRGVIQFVIGSYIEPRVAGRALSVSPFVLVSVFLWTFAWGLFGAAIGVPITIAVLTLLLQHPSGRWLADLLGAQTDVTPTKKPP